MQRNTRRKPKAVGTIFYPTAFAEGVMVPLVVILSIRAFPFWLYVALKDHLPQIIEAPLRFEFHQQSSSTGRQIFETICWFTARNAVEVKLFVQRVLVRLHEIHNVHLVEQCCGTCEEALAEARNTMEMTARPQAIGITNTGLANLIVAEVASGHVTVSDVIRNKVAASRGDGGYLLRNVQPRATEILERLNRRIALPAAANDDTHEQRKVTANQGESSIEHWLGSAYVIADAVANDAFHRERHSDF